MRQAHLPVPGLYMGQRQQEQDDGERREEFPKIPKTSNERTPEHAEHRQKQ